MTPAAPATGWCLGWILNRRTSRPNGSAPCPSSPGCARSPAGAGSLARGERSTRAFRSGQVLDLVDLVLPVDRVDVAAARRPAPSPTPSRLRGKAVGPWSRPRTRPPQRSLVLRSACLNCERSAPAAIAAVQGSSRFVWPCGHGSVPRRIGPNCRWDQPGSGKRLRFMECQPRGTSPRHSAVHERPQRRCLRNRGPRNGQTLNACPQSLRIW